MSLVNYWRDRLQYRDTICGEVHLAVVTTLHTHPNGVLACSVFPLVTNEVTSWRVQRNFKTATCERCAKLHSWLQLQAVLRELRDKAAEGSVSIRFIHSTVTI